MASLALAAVISLAVIFGPGPRLPGSEDWTPAGLLVAGRLEVRRQSGEIAHLCASQGTSFKLAPCTIDTLVESETAQVPKE